MIATRGHGSDPSLFHLIIKCGNPIHAVDKISGIGSNIPKVCDIHRLERTDPAIIAEVQVSNDQEHFVLFAGKVDTSGQILPRPLRLTGLDPNCRYRIELVNRSDANHLSRGQQLLKSDSLVVSGRALMNQGIALPWSFQDVLWVVQGQRLDD